MKYKRFEELPVWKTGIELGERVFRLTDDRSFNGRGDLRNQLLRAAISIGNNVAEGFERGTTQELLTFLYYARGSAGEVRSMLHLCDRVSYFEHLKSEISNLRSMAESVSRQLRAWADSLQNSDIKGPRYLTDTARTEHENKSRAEAFWQELDATRPGEESDSDNAGRQTAMYSVPSGSGVP